MVPFARVPLHCIDRLIDGSSRLLLELHGQLESGLGKASSHCRLHLIRCCQPPLRLYCPFVPLQRSERCMLVESLSSVRFNTRSRCSPRSSAADEGMESSCAFLTCVAQDWGTVVFCWMSCYGQNFRRLGIPHHCTDVALSHDVVVSWPLTSAQNRLS